MGTGHYKAIDFQYSNTDHSFQSAIRFVVADSTVHGGQIEFWTDNSSGTNTKTLTLDKSQNATFAGKMVVGDATDQQQWIVNKAVAGHYSGIKLTRGAGDNSSASANNHAIWVSDSGLNFGKTNDATVDAFSNVSTHLTLNADGLSTFAGDVVSPGIYVGSRNTSYDFYNNGTSYLNGTTTIDDTLYLTGTQAQVILPEFKGVRLYNNTTQVAFDLPSFTNGVANLACDILLGNVTTNGIIELTLTSTYSHQNAVGEARFKWIVGFNPSGSIWYTPQLIERRITHQSTQIYVADPAWDSTNSRYYIRVYHKTSTGNQWEGHIKYTSGGVAQNLQSNITTTGLLTSTSTTATHPVGHYLSDQTGDMNLILESKAAGDPTLTLTSQTANRSGMINFQDQGVQTGQITYKHNGDTMEFYTGGTGASHKELTLNESVGATFRTDVTVNGLLKGPSSIVSIDNRVKIIGSSHQLNIGQWDTVSHRIEGDANRPIHITSYQGHVYLGTSGSTKLDVHNSGITVTGTIVKSGGTGSQFLMADGTISTHISPNGHLNMNDNNIDNVGDLDFTRSFPFNVASKTYNSSNTTGYSTSGGSFDDWIKVAEFGEGEGTTYFNVKSAAHGTASFVISRGYWGSNAASITCTSSVYNANGSYANVRGIRVIREDNGSGGASTTYSIQLRICRTSAHSGYEIYCKAWGGGYNTVNGCLDFLTSATTAVNDGTGHTVLAVIPDLASTSLDQLSTDYISLWAAKPIISESNIISKASISVEKDGGELVLTTTGSGHGSINTTDSKDLNIAAASGTVYVNNNFLPGASGVSLGSSSDRFAVVRTNYLDSAQSSTTDPVLRLTDSGVADYDVVFPDTSTYRLQTSTSSTKNFHIYNAGSGGFTMEVDGAITAHGDLKSSAGKLDITGAGSFITHGTSWGTNLKLTNTNDDVSPPIITFLKNQASGHSAIADNDYVGFTNYRMKNTNGDEFSWVELSAIACDVTDGSEDSAYRIGTWGAGTEYPNSIIAKSGKVGINIATPGAQLHNYSTSTQNVWLSGYGTLAQNTWGAGHGIFAASDNGLLISKANAANDTNRLFSFYHDSGGNAEYYMYNTGQTNTVKIDSSGTSHFNGGDIGIGTASPAEKLEVSGSVKVGNMKFEPTHGGRIGFNRNTATGAIYDSNYAAFQINGAYSGADFLEIQNYNSSGNFLGSVALKDGKFGIGTTSPSANLHVSSTSTATLKVGTTGVADASVDIRGYDAGVHIGDATNGLRWAVWNDGPSTSSSLKFGSYALGTWYADGSQVATMTSDGKVGIGTVTPDGKLEIAGGTTLGFRLSNAGDSSAYDQVRMTYGGYNSGAPTVTLMPLTTPGSGNVFTTWHFSNSNGSSGTSNNHSNVVVDGNLNVGNAKGSGETVLQIRNYDTALVDTNEIQSSIRMSGRYWSGSASQLVETRINSVHQESNGNGGSALTFMTQTGGDAVTEQMRINKNGYVGIGTQSPASLLHVSGNSYLLGANYGIYGNNDITNYYIKGNSSGSQLVLNWYSGFQFKTLGGTDRLIIESTGIVGMGDTGVYAGTNAQLNLPGRGIAIKNDRNGSNNNWSYIYNTGTSSQANFDFVTGTGTALTLNHDKTATFTNSISITGTVTASSDIVAYSDQRLKTDVETLDGSKVYDMRGVSFTKDDKKGSGVIAQELEKIAPELVNNDSEFKSVAYGNITGYLIEAIKDLKAEVEELKKQIK